MQILEKDNYRVFFEVKRHTKSHKIGKYVKSVFINNWKYRREDSHHDIDIKPTTLIVMLKNVKKIKKMLDVEYDKWAHSKTSSTFNKVRTLRQKFVALCVPKEIYSLVILLATLKPTVYQLGECFWFRGRGSYKESRLKAGRLLRDLYTDAVIMFKAQKFVDDIEEDKIKYQEYIAKCETESKVADEVNQLWEKEIKHEKNALLNAKSGQKRKREDGDEKNLDDDQKHLTKRTKTSIVNVDSTN